MYHTKQTRDVQLNLKKMFGSYHLRPPLTALQPLQLVLWRSTLRGVGYVLSRPIVRQRQRLARRRQKPGEQHAVYVLACL